MRFVRVYTDASGVIKQVAECEAPFSPELRSRERDASGNDVPLFVRDLGMAEDFGPTDLAGKPCAPSMHLLQRLEVATAEGVRAKAGREGEIPVFHDVPTTVDGIKALVRAKGPGAIPERVAHWLEYMEVLADHEMDAAGLPRLTYASAVEFDAIRKRRDPSHGSRADAVKRRISERAKWRKAGR